MYVITLIKIGVSFSDTYVITIKSYPTAQISTGEPYPLRKSTSGAKPELVTSPRLFICQSYTKCKRYIPTYNGDPHTVSRTDTSSVAFAMLEDSIDV